ncbi:MAG: TIGR04141 family sporadically distributed protein [Calditrichaeota bacterium]|nr:TIGR04141 family sporadically distributed protein [Calditrichota bacterium]
MPTKSKIWRLTLRLIKDSTVNAEDALSSKGTLSKFPLSSGLDFNGTLFVKEPEGRPPDWVSFLSDGLKSSDRHKIENMYSQSLSAVLLVEITYRRKSRFFALTFGHGRHLLETNCSVQDFGLKVALNSVNPDSLRSIDAATIDDNTIQTRKQSSQQSSIDEFGVDTSRDLLRAVTGIPNDPKFANSVSGAEALAITLPIELNDLGNKCKEILKVYKGSKYKERFAWVDNVALVRSTSTISDLDRKLADKLLDKESIGVHMAPPAILPNIDSGFRFSTETDEGNPHAFLELSDFMSSIKSGARIDIEALRRKHKVFVKNSLDGTMEPAWSVYDCLVFDTILDGSKYVLFSGKWYEVSKDFTIALARYVDKIPLSKLKAPNARSNEREDAYSKRATKSSGGKWILLDKETVKVSTASGRIEICDILTDAGQFVHIKPWHQSSTLSHLFAQARISTDCLLNDSKYRESIKAKVPALMGALKAKLSANDVDPKSFEVVLAVISKSGYRWPTSFPFFSQLNLMHTSKWLNDRQVKHSLLHIVRS